MLVEIAFFLKPEVNIKKYSSAVLFKIHKRCRSDFWKRSAELNWRF